MRLLLVEDEKVFREALKNALLSEHFSVDTAEDGERGSYLARTNEYDLIILDNGLPKKDGLDVCKDIRQAGKMTPIIILTVQSEIPTKVSLLDVGADDYVTKPFSFEELVARIRAVLRRPETINHQILEIGKLKIDLNEQSIRQEGREIYLTRKEYELLAYLARNPNKVLSRGLIMEHVWDINADPFSNTLETHILNLRRKIGDNPKNRLIQTVPGRGYKLELK